MSAITLNLKPLRKLLGQVGELERGRVQVGLFADTAGRINKRPGIAHNPSLGAVHEFGLSFSRKRDKATTTIPRRSFLQMPLTLFLGPEVLRNGANWLYLLSTKGAKRTLAILGLAGEDIVQEAFATGGFGQWPALKPETIRRKGSSAILIETAQLRKAVSSRVVI